VCAKFGNQQLAGVRTSMATPKHCRKQNVRHIYVIWFQWKLKWFRLKTEVKEFLRDAFLNALCHFGLKPDCSD